MQDIKLILVDLDGTLLTDDKKVTLNTVNTIQKARDQGIRFGIATGRSLYAVEQLLDDWHLREQCDIMMGFNGAQIRIPELGIDELNYQMQGPDFLEIIDHFKDLPVNQCVYDKTDLYALRLDDLAINVAKGNRFTPKAIANVETFFTREFPKLVIICEPEDMPLVKERAKTFSSPNYHCFQTGASLFEYVRPEVSKSSGIKHICDLYNTTTEHVCVFGDAQNDNDMIEKCGWGVCMINGSDATKALSQDITDLDNNHDGVADYIEKHFIHN